MNLIPFSKPRIRFVPDEVIQSYVLQPRYTVEILYDRSVVSEDYYKLHDAIQSYLFYKLKSKCDESRVQFVFFRRLVLC